MSAAKAMCLTIDLVVTADSDMSANNLADLVAEHLFALSLDSDVQVSAVTVSEWSTGHDCEA